MTILPIETASVFEPLLAKDPRYYGAHGGRGLGKSRYFAVRLVRAVCFSLGLVAQPLAPVSAGESLQEKPTMTKHTIVVLDTFGLNPGSRSLTSAPRSRGVYPSLTPLS